MNTAPTQDSKTRYYRNSDSIGFWVAGVTCVGVIAGGASLAQHSFALTSCLLLGTVSVGYVGYWLLSKTCYFISDTKAGFKDLFRSREVEFAEIQSATKRTGRSSCDLVFECTARTVTMPVDLLDETWFSAVKAELLKRGIPITHTALGFTVKDE